MAFILTVYIFNDTSSGIKLGIFNADSTEVDYFKTMLPDHIFLPQRSTGMYIK
jgi:hypothetical protein